MHVANERVNITFYISMSRERKLCDLQHAAIVRVLQASKDLL